MNVFNIH